MDTYFYVMTMVCCMCMMIVLIEQGGDIGISIGNREFISILGSPNTQIIDQDQFLL
ncbi:hypothetical protein ACSVDA_24570 [Cytobacillus sp. Hm23]